MGPFQNKIQERKFVVAKKNSRREAPTTFVCKCKEKAGNSKKCPCIAYESLRASQEGFFRTRGDERGSDSNELKKDSGSVVGSRKEKEGFGSKEIEGVGSSENESEMPQPEEIEFSSEEGSSTVKRIRNRLLEEARNSIPEPGSGRVMHLVKAFENILSIPNANSGNAEEGEETVMKWGLPGLQPKATETEVTSSSFLPGDLFFASKNFDMDSRVWSSMDSSSHGRSVFSK